MMTSDFIPPDGYTLLGHDGDLRTAMVAKPSERGGVLIERWERHQSDDMWRPDMGAGIYLEPDELKGLLCMLVNLATPEVTVSNPDSEAP